MVHFNILEALWTPVGFNGVVGLWALRGSDVSISITNPSYQCPGLPSRLLSTDQNTNSM